MEESLFGLRKNDIEKINGVFANYVEIQEVIIYGSRVKGNYKNGSDIDLAVFGENITNDLLFRIKIELDDLLIPYKIDILLFSSIENDELKSHIQRLGQNFYHKSIELL